MGLFGGGSSPSNDPFAGFAAAQQAQAAQMQTVLGMEALAFAKEQAAIGNERQKKVDALTEKVVNAQLGEQERLAGWATEDRARWKSIFQPLQDKFIDKAGGWDSADAQAKAAAEARAGVMSNADAARAANSRAMAARGINPQSGAWAGIDRAQDTAVALGAAGAENNVRNQLRREAIGLQGDALNIGAGLPSQALDATRTGVATGTAAAGVNLAAEGNWRGNQSIMQEGYKTAGNMIGQAGQSWGNIYDNRVGLLNQQQQIDAANQSALLGGIGSAVGIAGSLAMKSDEDAKEDKREVKGILQALKNMPVEAWRYKEGEGDGGEHVGTYAQDFTKATGLGDGKNINVVDAIGVTMGAVKELAEKVEAIKGGKDGDEKPARAKPKSIMRRKAA